MTTLQHSIKIAAPRRKTFEAISNIAQIAQWHLGEVGGEIGTGAVLYLTPKPGLRFGWQTEEIVPVERVIQICVEGPGSSVGNTLTFALSDLDDGGTLVALSDADWSEDDPHLPFCNTHWGKVLHQLKSYVERHNA
jgi:uncharacterized protein YndB with AHSA1/START domain